MQLRQIVLHFVVVGLLASACFSQTKIDLATQGRNADFSSFPSTRPFAVGSGLPASCAVGAVFFNSSEIPGENLYVCTSPDTWTKLKVGRPWESGTTLPATCSVGEAYYKVDATAGQNLYLCTASDLWTQADGPPPTAAPYLVLDNHAGLTTERKVVADQGVMITDGGANGTATFGLDPTYVPTFGGNNAFTGITDFSSAAELRLLTGAGIPVATDCSAADEVGRVYVRSDSDAVDSSLYLCTNAGTGAYAWEGPYKSAAGPPGGTASELQFRSGASAFGGVRGSVVNDNKLSLGPDETEAGLNVGTFAGDPSSPDNGDIWYNSATNRFRCNENGEVKDCTGAVAVLSTKGDLHGFSTSNARVPVGSDGQVLAADSGVATGLSYGYLKEEIAFRLGTRDDSGADHPLDIMSDPASGMTIGHAGSWPESVATEAVLADGADRGGVLHFVLPVTYEGNATMSLYWRTADAATDSVRWQVEYSCVGAGEDFGAANLANAGGVSAANDGSDLLNVTSVPLTLTGCTGGDWLRLYIFRDGDGTEGTDDLAADIAWLGGRFTFLRRLQ